MDNLKTNWSPFPIEYSSCSSIKPSNFSWSNTQGIASVCIDRHIIYYKGNSSNNFGWFCESSEILPDLKEFIKNEYRSLRSKFIKIFTCDRELIELDPSFFEFNPPGSNLPWTSFEKFGIPTKSKSVSMLCSSKDMTSGHKLRLDVAKNLSNKIDLFGGANQSSRIGEGIGPKGDWWRSKEEALSPYRFSIVFENANYPKYYTEKITDCFAFGVVPIYWGTDLISEDFNSEGIIKWSPDLDVNLLTEELYMSKMEAIKDNLERVKNLELADEILYKKIRISI